ncbi:hypothetical protein MTR67_031177 [Solanum verrucosum]|uniref:Reverse transcriptase RNase H-like domain-containing protein n=1 Tax=Solanum verrucosum TaxID=315347 RepID=A0AAF0U1Y9_SOLVR|nr:hypothetical protein MTR67_031177 [Solanum verrucosum]
MHCEISTDDHILKYLFSQSNLNIRQCKWLELLKDYDITIPYHSSKENVIVDTLSRKKISMGSIAFLNAEETPSALEVHSFSRYFVGANISTPHHIFLNIKARPTLMDHIYAL